jgi:hypothetical protein
MVVWVREELVEEALVSLEDIVVISMFEVEQMHKGLPSTKNRKSSGVA